MSSLLSCKPRFEGHEAQWANLMQDFEKCKPGKHVPFHWKDGGLFRTEMKLTLEQKQNAGRMVDVEKKARQTRIDELKASNDIQVVIGDHVAWITWLWLFRRTLNDDFGLAK